MTAPAKPGPNEPAATPAAGPLKLIAVLPSSATAADVPAPPAPTLVPAQRSTSPATEQQSPVGESPAAESIVTESCATRPQPTAGAKPDQVSVDAVSDYLRQIGTVALLTAEQEIELARRIEAGVLAAERLAAERLADERLADERLADERLADERLAAERLADERLADEEKPTLSVAHRAELRMLVRDGERATDHMLRANLRLVVSVAKRYIGAGLPLSDLIQEGNLGLIRAVQKFDHTKGFKFSTYATWWIRQAILRAVADQTRTIRVPVHMVDALNKINRLQRELAQKLGREPTLDELAEQSGECPDKIVEIRRITRQPISLDQPVSTDSEVCLADLVASTSAASDAVLPDQLREHLESLLATLNEREQLVLRLRCGLIDGTKHSFEQISRVFGKSRERVRHIETAALRKLRPLAETGALREFLTD